MIFSDDVYSILLLILQERLTAKQKRILALLQNRSSKKPVTPTIQILAHELACSVSAVWLNMKQLKRMQLLDYGSAKTKGKLVMLTPIGKWVAENIGR